MKREKESRVGWDFLSSPCLPLRKWLALFRSESICPSYLPLEKVFPLPLFCTCPFPEPRPPPSETPFLLQKSQGTCHLITYLRRERVPLSPEMGLLLALNTVDGWLGKRGAPGRNLMWHFICGRGMQGDWFRGKGTRKGLRGSASSRCWSHAQERRPSQWEHTCSTMDDGRVVPKHALVQL